MKIKHFTEVVVLIDDVEKTIEVRATAETSDFSEVVDYVLEYIEKNYELKRSNKNGCV